MIDQLILVEPVLKNQIMFEAPFKMAASGPTGDVALSHGKAFFVKGGDDVLVRDAVAEHPVDHVALDFGETSDAASTARLVGLDGGGEQIETRNPKSEARSGSYGGLVSVARAVEDWRLILLRQGNGGFGGGRFVNSGELRSLKRFKLRGRFIVCRGGFG